MNIKGHCYPKSIILLFFKLVHFKLRFTLSYRDVDEIIKINRVLVGLAKIQLWVYKLNPFVEGAIEKTKSKS